MEQAQAEFELSGVEPFATTIYYPDSFPEVGRASLVIADSLSELGINVTVTEIPLEQWLSTIGNGEQGLAWMIYIATTAEPIEMVSWLLSGGGPGTNPANFEDEQIASLIASAFAKPGVDAIVEILEAHSLAQEQAIYIPVWWGEAAIAWGSRINVSDFNSYTMLSQNWVQHFSFE
jgi:peptide/nickel transport system substrate-binding protein